MKPNKTRKSSRGNGRESRENEIHRQGLQEVRFSYYNGPANQVSIAGDFNEWDPSRLLLTRESDGRWAGRVKLAPGEYEYLFVVDGEWQLDPGADAVPNPFGTRNSVLRVKAPELQATTRA